VNNHLLDTPDYAPGVRFWRSITIRRRERPSIRPASAFRRLDSSATHRGAFFYGPGIENTDLTLLKNIALGSSRTLQARLEAFNVFNRAQYYGPGAVDGNIASSTFGQIVRGRGAPF